jgi:HAMP domain-containing protein
MVRTVTERITTESASSLSMLWVSAAVLLLMLFATLFTVVGVTRPVRRLTEATRRIARGDTDVSLPRGGARELDELGLAFNASSSGSSWRSRSAPATCSTSPRTTRSPTCRTAAGCSRTSRRPSRARTTRAKASR